MTNDFFQGFIPKITNRIGAVGTELQAPDWQGLMEGDKPEPIQPNNEIWYVATNRVTPHNTEAFGSEIVYLPEESKFDPKTGMGILKFNGDVTNIGGCAFSGCSDLTSVEIPNSVTNIEYQAFAGCSGLTSVNIPDGVTSIGYQAFAECKSLTSVTIPDGVTSIEQKVFYECNRLKSVTIPNSVTSIGFNAFGYCFDLTSLTIPDGVTSIGDWAFSCCNHLTSITFEAITPAILGGSWSSVFDNTSCPIYVPAQSVETYKSAPGWSGVATRIQPAP